MRWSWKVGRIAGVELRVHATFVLLLAWLALARWTATGNLVSTLGGLLFTLALFASVVLHELGHAGVARRCGVATRDITLLPIGGVARLESMPSQPSAELRIALAGPAVSAVLALALYVVASALAVPVADPMRTMRMPGAFVAQLMWANVALLTFNLLPAFPMDGGRVLRALLARRMGNLHATEIAYRVGRTLALLLGAIGLMTDPLLALIALFVWLAAAGEMASVQLRTVLGGVPVERVMLRDVTTLAPDDPLEVAITDTLTGFQQDFPVVDGERLVGVLTRERLLDGLRQSGRHAAVAEVMDRDFGTTHATESLEQALGRLQASHRRTLPVVDDGRLRGVLTSENVGEYVLIDAALRQAARAGSN